MRPLLSAGALIAAGMLAGRLLGLLREMLLAAQFGSGSQADTAIALLILPDFIAGALIGSAASAMLIPAFASRGAAQAAALFWQAMGVSLLAFALIALLGTVTLGDSPLWMLALAALPLTAATAVVTSWLQYRGRFLVPAFANAIFNAVVILTLWRFPGGLLLLASGILAAAAIRLAAHLLALARAGGLTAAWHPWQLDGPLLRAYAATAATGMLGMLPQYAPYGVIALLGGALAVFNYAFKLLLLPGAVIQTMVQLVLLPWFVHLRQNAHVEAQALAFGRTLQVGWILSLAACLSLSLGAQDIARICFGYGHMTPEAIHEVGRLFAIGVWAMPGMVLTSIWQQIFYAHQRVATALVASALQTALVLPLCLLGQAAMGDAGTVAAFALLQLLPVGLLGRQARRAGFGAAKPASSFRATLAMLALFAPMAWGSIQLSLPSWAQVAAAGAIGALLLGAGLASAGVRSWMR